MHQVVYKEYRGQKQKQSLLFKYSNFPASYSNATQYPITSY